MLTELHVRGLGVISDATLTFGPGLCALTGETGAGKTLLVDALDLVRGGKPTRGLARAEGSVLIEARFLGANGDEVVVAREIPSDGRSRAWLNGRMATVAVIAEQTRELCDIHGQHEHQSLLRPGAFRRALDAFGSIDTSTLDLARGEYRAVLHEQRSLGGDPGTVSREIALLEHQLAEIERAALSGPDELELLLAEAKILGAAHDLEKTLLEGLTSLEGDDRSSPRDTLAFLRRSVEGYASLGPLAEALLEAEGALDAATHQLRDASERIEHDPGRLAHVNERLELLHDLCRRYGPGLDDVLARSKELHETLESLRATAARRDGIESEIVRMRDRMLVEEHAIEVARRSAAPQMATALTEQLERLALGRATVELDVSGSAGDDVTLLFSSSPALTPRPVASVASGGELARLMLAIRLILPGGPSTMVFDEVDAGVGGATAITLAEALFDVAQQRQVLVVTHLAQVAALADQQISVVRDLEDDTARPVTLDHEGRIKELARMLSGKPESPTAQQHAAELLASPPSTAATRRVV